MPGRTRARGRAPTPRRSSRRAAAAPMPPTPTTTTRRRGRARGRDQGVPREAPQSDGQVNLQHSLQDFLSLVRRQVQQGLQPATESQAHQPVTESQAAHPPSVQPATQGPSSTLHQTLPQSGVQGVSPVSLPCANIVHGQYRYTSDLTTLASTVAPSSAARWPCYHTPIQLDLLQPYLDIHPDQTYATYIANGLRDGFRVGCEYGAGQLKPRNRNHPSCLAKPSIVTDRILAEISAGRLLGPISPDLLAPIHRSPMGLIPKPHQPNKFRLIVDLSAPAGKSVNDGISSALCSLKYASVDDAVTMIRAQRHPARKD